MSSVTRNRPNVALIIIGFIQPQEFPINADQCSHGVPFLRLRYPAVFMGLASLVRLI